MVNKNIQQWSRIFKGLGNPYRLEIVKFLKKNGKTSVSDLTKEIRISIKNTSRNLKILHDLEILESLGKSDHVFYSINSSLDKEIETIVKFFAK
jgi:DNA-binding transcriptional ArsR family regulator